MPRRGERDPERERFWRRTMKAWARSGQSIRAFCEAEGVSEWSFHAWRRELRKRDGEREQGRKGASGSTARQGTRAKAATGRDATRASARPSFLPVRITASPAPIEIERNGTTIRLHGEVDPEVLAGVLEAVRRVSC